MPDEQVDEAAAIADPGAVRNTFLQLASQLSGALFTGALALYLVRALGASGYGVYALAVSIGTLVLYPAGLGLPWAIGRFLADHLSDLGQLRAIFLLGLRLQLAAAAVAAVALLVAAGPLASAFGEPQLVGPLRWIAASIVGQALFAYLVSAVTSVRRVSIGMWMAIAESSLEMTCAIALVIGGAGAAGAVLGKAAGYGVAAAIGCWMVLRLLRPARGTRATVHVGLRTITRYAGAMFVVDVTWSAIAQIDVLLIGAMLTTEAVGSFGAVLRILTVLSYLGIAVSSGVAPRLSLRHGKPDTRAFSQGIRYLVLAQGLVIAPMVVWATPIVTLLLGSGYSSSPAILRVLSIQAFVSAPASLISVAVTYLGEARRRLRVVLATLLLGLITTYVLINAVGVVGAAIGDDIVIVVYVAAHLWIAGRLIEIDRRGLVRALSSTLLAVGAMALPLLAAGTEHLSVVQWIVGGSLGLAAYGAVLVVRREVSLGDLRAITGRFGRGPGAAPAAESG